MTLAIKRIHNLPPHLSYVSTLPDILQKPKIYVVFLSVVWVALKRTNLACRWLWKESVVWLDHSTCPKWRPFAFMRARVCHWSMAFFLSVRNLLYDGLSSWFTSLHCLYSSDVSREVLSWLAPVWQQVLLVFWRRRNVRNSLQLLQGSMLAEIYWFILFFNESNPDLLYFPWRRTVCCMKSSTRINKVEPPFFFFSYACHLP